MMHEIEYEIRGDDLQYVEVLLDPMEAVVAEARRLLGPSRGL